MKIAETYSDAELIALISEGKNLNEAIRAVFGQFSGAVRAYLMSRGAGQQDAEDLFQETVIAFIDAVKKEKFRKESSVKTFLIAIARNLWLNLLDKQKRSAAREKAYESEQAREEQDVSEFIAEREAKQVLRGLLNELGENCRRILIMFYYENLSTREMLDQLPYESEQVVRNKKYKCLQQLSEMVKRNPALGAQIQFFSK